MENIDLIYEVTLYPEEHKIPIDLKINIYRETDKRLSHGPRVKFYKNKKDDDSFSISINENNEKIKHVSGNYRKLVSGGTLIRLINRVRDYKIPFLNAWYNPNVSKEMVLNQMRMIDRGEKVELIKPK